MQPAHFKSRTYRRVKVRIPSGKVTTHFKKGKPKQAHCAVCGKPLNGVPRTRPVEAKHLAKTKKRPERPFGGYLCSECARRRIISKIRG